MSKPLLLCMGFIIPILAVGDYRTVDSIFNNPNHIISEVVLETQTETVRLDTKFSSIKLVCPTILHVPNAPFLTAIRTHLDNCGGVCFNNNLFLVGVLKVDQVNLWCCCSPGSPSDIAKLNYTANDHDVHKSHINKYDKQHIVSQSSGWYTITNYVLASSNSLLLLTSLLIYYLREESLSSIHNVVTISSYKPFLIGLVLLAAISHFSVAHATPVGDLRRLNHIIFVKIVNNTNNQNEYCEEACTNIRSTFTGNVMVNSEGFWCKCKMSKTDLIESVSYEETLSSTLDTLNPTLFYDPETNTLKYIWYDTNFGTPLTTYGKRSVVKIEHVSSKSLVTNSFSITFREIVLISISSTFGLLLGLLGSNKFKKNRVNFGSGWLMLLCLSTICISSVDSQTCNAIPISLGNITSCNGNVCYLTQTTNVALPLIPGSSVCMMFVSPDGVSPVQYMNLTLDFANFVFSPDYSYYSDDPVITAPTKCNCPLGGVALDNQYCQWNVYEQTSLWNRSGTIWLSGNNPGVGCAASKVGFSASHCASLGVSVEKRFKTVHFPQNPSKAYQISAYYNLTTNNTQTWQSWAVEYFGTPTYSMGDSNAINITVVSDTATYNSFWEFLEFDMQSPTDYYLLTSSDVNGLDEANPAKIGYIRTVDPALQMMVPPNVANLITTTVLNCANNQFVFNYPWHATADLLSERKRYLSSHLWPNSVYVDPDYYYQQPYVTSFGGEISLEKEEPQLYVDPYFYLADGWLIRTSNTPFVGKTVAGYTVPFPVITGVLVNGNQYQNVSSNCGFTNLTGIYVSYTTVYYYDFGINSTALMQLLSWGGFAPNASFCYSVCTYQSSITAANAINGGCTNVNLTSIAWPSLTPQIFTFNNTGFSQTAFRNDPPLSAIQLYGPTTNGVVNVVVQFNNLEIQFSNSLIQPKITLAGSNNVNGMWIMAQSVTVGGVCYVASNPPGIIITQPITLGVTLTNFTYNFNQAQFTGVAGVVLECAAQIATYTLNLNYNLSPNNSDFQNGTNNNPWFPGNWWPSLPGIQFPDNSINELIDWLLWIAYIVAFIVIGIILFIIAWKIIIIVWSFSKFTSGRIYHHTTRPFRWISNKSKHHLRRMLFDEPKPISQVHRTGTNPFSIDIKRFETKKNM